jgi:hypothetical protein
MSTNVRVVADEFGNVVNISANNPEYGYVRLEQEVHQISETGWLRATRRSALLKGTVTDLVNAKFVADMELPGKIIVKESLEPFNSENPEKHIKIAGDTGVICNIGGQPIYRDSFYTRNESAEDILIMHDEDCSEAIRNVKQAEVTARKVLLKKYRETREQSQVVDEFEKEAVL